MKKAFIRILVIAAVAAAVYLSGPRVAVDTTITFDPTVIGSDPEAYLAVSEAQVPGIRAGMQKEIIWAYPQSRAKTPFSIVYVHGFSASKGEIRPLPDMVARELGANLFFTRLTGHGRDGPAMGRASVNTWVNDMAEALAIGRAIGERVVIMSTSTGGSLATWAATDRTLMDKVAGLVFLSPNYGMQAAGSRLLIMPWGEQLAELLIGKERSFQPLNEMHAALWTTKYQTRAILPMAAMAKLARDTKVEAVTIPALFIYSEQDQVVRPELTKEIAARWSGTTETIIVNNSGDPSNHVIAGDALSPATTGALVMRTMEWINKLH